MSLETEALVTALTESFLATRRKNKELEIKNQQLEQDLRTASAEIARLRAELRQPVTQAAQP